MMGALLHFEIQSQTESQTALNSLASSYIELYANVIKLLTVGEPK